ncbi:DUF1631 family protein [Rhodanobacter sp. MP7CTX1]|uniref:DUF1631 family protein n=1 Tax=Rhodanobacter sp. MP7CTX1 TaxID=2723084 RepID=UPI00160EF257|nr:DUF1631 family protein [Rhodanobacter sp. MP7CTX1]MBB6187782.1 hypothetical protein [Rhodanobacter sp. MP7CTX1]
MDIEPSVQRPSAVVGARHPREHQSTRAQRLIGEILSLCESWLHEPLRLCLGDFDVRLHDKAEHTRSHLSQQRYLTTRQSLLQGRKMFDQHFIASLRQGFDELGVKQRPVSTSFPLSLSLLDSSDHDLVVALDQLVARSEARGGQVLVELSYRLGVLVGAPPLEGAALPLGPHGMTTAFREASKALSLPGNHELLLVQSLESSLMQRLGPLYEMVNAHLLADGILPRLRAFSLPREAPRRARMAVPKSPPTEDKVPLVETAPRAPPVGGLRGLLASQRANRVDLPATTDELQNALRLLQKPRSPLSHYVSRELFSSRRLREELHIQLNAGRASGTPRTCLSTDQDDTVELISRLFDQLGRQLQDEGDAKALLSGLQLPLLRAAVSDQQFFDRREHPARQLLDKMTQAMHDWLDDEVGGEVAHDLRPSFEKVVERANQEPQRTSIYTTLLVEIEQHVAQWRSNAIVAERRHVEAVQDHERLEQARHRVATLLEERLAYVPSDHPLRPLLDHTWSDVLSLTLLRHGEDSETFATQLVITDQLMGRLPAGDRQRLGQKVQSGLLQIGMHGEEASQIAQELILAGVRPAGDSAGYPEQHQHSANRVTRKRMASDAGLEPGPQERRTLQRLHKLPSESWFERVNPASGRVSQRKLAWYSPLSGRSLFVTRRGQCSEELSLQQLAEELTSGRMREMSATSDSLLDRAWQTLTDGLRQSPLIHP